MTARTGNYQQKGNSSIIFFFFLMLIIAFVAFVLPEITANIQTNQQYDKRWAGVRPISGDEWHNIDQALRDANSEADGSKDVYLQKALEGVGVYATGKDAYEAANYLLERGFNTKKDQKQKQQQAQDLHPEENNVP